jgi:mono/diheme cytochrome c family protein
MPGRLPFSTTMKINPTILILILGLLCQSAIGDSEAAEFLPNSERREPSIDGILTWDAIAKVHHAKLNELDIGFEFYFQNKTSKEVQIKRAISTCGCTVAKLPNLPWVIKPAQKGSVPVTMDLRGKSGVITKTIQLVTDQGIIPLKARVAIGLVSGPSKKRSKDERAANLRAAAANRQAIFAGKCVECHVIPTIGKRGKQLYSTACGICHESKNRAPFVTDLRRLAKGKDKEYWQQWITDSKPNSLMPAFAKQHGGNLDNSQIRTLVAYLTRIFPRELKTRRAVAVKNKPVLK